MSQAHPIICALVAPPTAASTGRGRFTLHTDLAMVVLYLVAAVDVLLFFWYLRASIIRQPFWDMFSWVLHYLDYRRDGGWWSYVWASHDVHRPVWIRLITAFDIEVFAGVTYPFIVFTTACFLITVRCLWRESRRGIRGTLGRPLGLIAVMLAMTSVAAVNCAVPFANGYVHVLMTAVLAIVLFDVDENNVPAARADGSVAWWNLAWVRRSTAMLAAINAPLASAAGVVVWPILLWLAWSGRAGRRWTLAVVVVGVAFLGVYSRGLSPALAAGVAAVTRVGSVDDLAGRANYLLTYMGLPWTRSTALILGGRIVGGLLLIAGTWAVVQRGVLRRPTRRLERIALALIMFSIGTAFMATAGRADAGGGGEVLVPVRYSVLLIPLHVGLLWLAASALQRFWDSPRGRSIVATALAAASVLLLGQQVAAGESAEARAIRMRAALARFDNGETDPEMTTIVYIDLEQARREWELISRAGVYLSTR